MAKSRKDSRAYVLRTGESQRKDGRYSYSYTDLDKKASANKIINDMAGGQSEYQDLFEEEFRVLTNIGNRFSIRHHETNKINTTDIRHCDYFLNRCLSLIALALQYLD